MSPGEPDGTAAPASPEPGRIERLLARVLPRRDGRYHFPFDVALGLLAPAALFGLDLWWDPADMGGVLPLRPYTPLLALAAMGCLVVWIPIRRPAWLGAFLAGPLVGAGLTALAIGILLLPLSIMGLFVAIGVLGFVPFLTGLVYLDAGLDALREGRARLGTAPALAAAACCGLLVAGLVGGAGRVVTGIERRETEVLLRIRPGEEERAVARLRLLRSIPGIRLDRLEREAAHADGADGGRLRGLFRRIAGRDVGMRFW